VNTVFIAIVLAWASWNRNRVVAPDQPRRADD
jgi:hypothetical protein